MDFLDSLDLHTLNKKSNRVRSWYLYEQFKSLERNQLEAAQKLKEKSYQDRILRQELSERRARRKIYDQFGLCESKSRIGRRIRSADSKTSRTVLSSDDLFESYCELHEDQERFSHVTEAGSSQDAISQDDSIPEKALSEDFKSIEDSKDAKSYAASVDSVIEIEDYSINLADDAKEKARTDIAKSLTKQLESVKEDIQCIENFTKLSDTESFNGDSIITPPSTKNVAVSKSDHDYNNNINAIWSKLVSFAYQVMQLNRGNCYDDYSSQLMTAVLACDVLRRGVNRMCDILQPYVTPIKFATDDTDINTEILTNSKRKKGRKGVPPSKQRKSLVTQLNPKNKARRNMKRSHFEKTYKSDDCRPYSKYSFENLKAKYRRVSEPAPNVSKSYYNGHTSQKSSCTSLWPDFSKDNFRSELCECWCHKKVSYSTVQMARYIDSLLKNIDRAYM